MKLEWINITIQICTGLSFPFKIFQAKVEHVREWFADGFYFFKMLTTLQTQTNPIVYSYPVDAQDIKVIIQNNTMHYGTERLA